MNIRNFTPHTITVVRTDGETIAKFQSEGIARCATTRQQIDAIANIPVNITRFGQVEGLPEPQADTVYIVSALVAQAVKGNRDDVVVPDDTVRDGEGRIMGCRAFARI